MITLRPITRENFRACIDLKTTPEQEPFVATNVVSIAQAYVEPAFVPRAIYDDETLVGFLMYGRDAETGADWIFRLMIGAEYQGRGYGRAALQQALGLLRRQPDSKEILISYMPENIGAERMYASLGFVPTGAIEHGEVIARLAERR